MSLKETWIDQDKTMDAMPEVVNSIAHAVIEIEENSSENGGGVVEETDPTVPEWAKQPNKPSYTADEVGAYSKEEADEKFTGAKTLVVNFTKADDGTIIADQTIDAIETAYEERKPILGFLTYTETTQMGGGATASITFNEQYYYVGGRTFTSLQIDKFRQIICNVWTDEWSLTVDAPMVKSSVVTQIDADSDDKHYPSAKAVVGFVATQIGDIETALDGLQYYGDASIIPTDSNYFDFTTDSETMTASVRLKEEFRQDSTLTKIVIPYEIEGLPVTSIGDYAFYDCTGLTSINIPNSVTNIGGFAFASCTGLTSINIPNSVTNIEMYAFQYCSSLTTINIPNSVTNIGTCAFYECTGLTSINIPNSVTNIEGYAFASCSSLTAINIPNSVTNIGTNAFYGCDNLTIICAEGSYVDGYAKENGIAVEYTNEVTKSYVDNQIGDIETALENIITKYGLGGDA